jgi:hypothetical protein
LRIINNIVVNKAGVMYQFRGCGCGYVFVVYGAVQRAAKENTERTKHLAAGYFRQKLISKPVLSRYVCYCFSYIGKMRHKSA